MKHKKITSNAGDWFKLIEADKLELGITLTDEEIKGVSKNVFKTFVKKRVKSNHLKYLNHIKKMHSKAKFLSCTDVKQADYLQENRFTTMEKQLLFKLRSYTLDVKQNFKGQHKNPWCSSCGLFQETQGHLLQCPALVTNLNYLSGKRSKLNENFVYGNVEQQEIMVKIYSDILEAREKLKQSLVN